MPQARALYHKVDRNTIHEEMKSPWNNKRL